MFHFEVKSVESPRQASQTIDVLRKPRLWIPTEKDYPEHAAWLAKTEAELTHGKKRALVGYMGKQPVGAVIYQLDPGQPDRLEIRNISISPEVGDRYVGSFLLRNSEREALAQDFPGITDVVVDTKVSNLQMIDFLTAHGYAQHEIADLYDSGNPDVVMTKALS